MSADVGFVGEHFFMLSIAISHVSFKDGDYNEYVGNSVVFAVVFSLAVVIEHYRYRHLLTTIYLTYICLT
jgi:hypothetical protein